MFDTLADRFDGIFQKLRSRGKLTDKEIDEVSRELRVALLEADVNVVVARNFIRARLPEVTAILDWEFAHMGDPAEDVNYCRQFIERYVPFDYFLGRYLSHGGKPYDAARDRFFTVWRNVRNAVASIGALNAFYSETPGNIKMATAGLAYNPRFDGYELRIADSRASRRT